MQAENPTPKSEVNVIEYMTNRRKIQKIFLYVILALYSIGWIIFHPADAPILSLVLGVILTPIFTFALYYRIHEFLFIRHWMYITYMVATTIVFGLAMYQFSNYFEYNRYYVLYEIGHAFIANMVGLITAIVVSLPFKVLHALMFDNVDDLYYTNDQLARLEETAFPEEKKKRVKKESEKNKYETFNETQLQVELNNLLKDEKYEEVDKVKKLLKTKFGHG